MTDLKPEEQRMLFPIDPTPSTRAVVGAPAGHARYLVGDAATALRTLPDASVDVAVTSPPYWAKARYTDDGRELGVGDLNAYVGDLVAVFDELLRVLAPTGALWLNIADTASGSGGSGGDYMAGGSRAARLGFRQGVSGLAPHQWCQVPGRVVDALQRSGWLLRSTVVWSKSRAKREALDHARRPGECWEPIFLLVPAHPNRRKLIYEWAWREMTEPGNVWTFAPDRDAHHPAVFPPELVRRCLEPFPSARTVLDPFAGRGTTLEVAVAAGRDAIGIDLNPEFGALAARRFDATVEAATATSHVA
jgi:DNA modification methylase